MLRAVLLLCLAAMPSSAQAPTGSWDVGGVRRWMVQAHFQSPYVLWLIAERNTEVRVAEVLLGAVLTCRAETAEKKFVEVVCDAEDASILAAPIESDKDRLVPVLLEYEAIFERAEIRFAWMLGGRVRDVRFKGLDVSDDRTKFMVDNAELFFERALAPLDVPLPPEGTAVGGAWPIKEPLAGKMPFSQGMSGSYRFGLTLDGADADGLRISGAGDGTVIVGDDRWLVEYAGEALVDPASGTPRTSKVTVVGSPSPGSPIAALGDPLPYALRSEVETLGPDDRPALVPSGRL